MADFPSGTDERPIELADAAPFTLGGLRVVPAERAVEFGSARRDVQPQVMRVLVALAVPRPAVVSRDRLIERAWDGVVVGDDALNRCILALRHLAQEFAPPPFTIETVPRVGHRLVEGQGGAVGRSAAPAGSFPRQLATALAVLLVAIVGVFAWQSKGSADAPASIAVLPFRNLSAGEPFFAQGLGEEILGQLAREPTFRVAGRNATAPPSDEGDLGKLGRSIGVEYVLDGSVRSERGRIRVNASLIQSSDGARLWSQTYDRDLNDVLAIQTAIGQAVAKGLKRQLVHSPSDRAPAIDGRAYADYLSARGLLRTQNPHDGEEALRLLRQSVRAAPQFAPAWSSLAQALPLDARTKGPDAMIAAVPYAIAAAQRAVRLDVDLAEAHAAMALLRGDGSRQGINYLERAASLAPQSVDGLMWRASASAAEGRYAEASAAYFRAHRLDPASPLPVRALIDSAAMAGDRARAETWARREFAGDVAQQQFALARIAWQVGDLSEAARRWTVIAETSTRWAVPARRGLLDARLKLGLTQQPAPGWFKASLFRSRLAPLTWLDRAPSRATWREQNRSDTAQLVYLADNGIAAKLMLNDGRAAELIATFESSTGFQGMRSGAEIQVGELVDVPVLALALRRVGREAEAEALLVKADARITYIYAQGGALPTWFEADAAGVWAVQGKTTPALDALDRAVRRGWVSAGPTDLPRIEDEPAFRPLVGHPRFEAIRARLAAKLARERAETRRALAV